MMRPRGFGKFFPALAVALSAAFLALAKTEEDRAGPFEVTVVRIVADTVLEVDASLWLQRQAVVSVRLAEIYAHDPRGEGPIELPVVQGAKSALAGLVAPGTRVRLHDVVFDKYGDYIVARVVTDDGIDVAKALLEKGLVQKMECGHRGLWCDGP